MYNLNRTEHLEIERALRDLHNRITENLQAFNKTVPHNCWLRRSEIESITANLIRTAKLAPRRRKQKTVWKIMHAFSWIRRVENRA
jgi:hypothetical protein